MRLFTCIFFSFMLSHSVWGQDSTARFTIHGQTTVVNQSKTAFSAPYSGPNSLETRKENATSLTTTLYAGMRLWKGASLVLNPEIAGGSGLSKTLGIAAAPNGETFRIGSAEPKLYVARLFFRQCIPLTKERVQQSDDINQLKGKIPTRCINLILGKVSIADYFDQNTYSHDPRTHFLSWGLMNNGAWDYAANTRGYTPSFIAEWITPQWEARYGFSLLPTTANGSMMNRDLVNVHAQNLEITHRFSWCSQPGAIRFMVFHNTANMGNYAQSLNAYAGMPSIVATRMNGRTKTGICLNAEQQVSPELGVFLRLGWNDGKNETWAYTEIDHTASGGMVWMGQRWKRPKDAWCFGWVSSGLSKQHRNYLAAGGTGFMLGDGRLNYGLEHFGETYYDASITENFHLTGAYQLALNPGYNRDRKGPVHIFTMRVHYAF